MPTQPSRLAVADPDLDHGRRRVGVAGGVDGADADPVLAEHQREGAGRSAALEGQAVELTAEARAGLAGGEAEGDAAARLAGEQQRRRAGEDLGPRRRAIADRRFRFRFGHDHGRRRRRRRGREGGQDLEAVGLGFAHRLAVDGSRVAVDGEVDQGAVDLGAAVDHRVGVAGVGEDRVGAAFGVVDVRAGVAEQLVGAAVAVEGVGGFAPLEVLDFGHRDGRAGADRGRAAAGAAGAAAAEVGADAFFEASPGGVVTAGAAVDQVAIADRVGEEEVVAVAAVDLVGAAVVEQGVVTAPGVEDVGSRVWAVDQHVFALVAAGKRVVLVAADQHHGHRGREVGGVERVVAIQAGEHDRVERRQQWTARLGRGGSAAAGGDGGSLVEAAGGEGEGDRAAEVGRGDGVGAAAAGQVELGVGAAGRRHRADADFVGGRELDPAGVAAVAGRAAVEVAATFLDVGTPTAVEGLAADGAGDVVGESGADQGLEVPAFDPVDAAAERGDAVVAAELFRRRVEVEEDAAVGRLGQQVRVARVGDGGATEAGRDAGRVAERVAAAAAVADAVDGAAAEHVVADAAEQLVVAFAAAEVVVAALAEDDVVAGAAVVGLAADAEEAG